jgi:uncharacterized protein (DUF885 family)
MEATSQEIKELDKELKLTIKKKNMKVRYQQLSMHVIKLPEQATVEEEIRLGKREVMRIEEERDRVQKKLLTKERKFAFALNSLKDFLNNNEKNEEEEEPKKLQGGSEKKKKKDTPNGESSASVPKKASQ